MRSMIEFAVEHSTAVVVLILCMFIGGFVSYTGLPRENAPEIAIPIVIVSTPYFGVSPSDIEVLVTHPLEKEFKGLKSLKKMTSTSAESVSLITLEFTTDVDIESAMQKVRDKIDKAKPDLPKDAEESEIAEINTSEFPVLIANISGDMDLSRLKEIGEALQDELEKIQGVLRVDLVGGVECEIQVLVDPEKMRHYGVSLTDINNVLAAENTNLPGGSLKIGSMKYLLRVPGEFQDMETIRSLVIKAPQGQPVFLRDVGEVHDSYKEQETYSRLTVWNTLPDGTRVASTQPNVSLSLVKRAGENIIEVADKAKEVISDYEQNKARGIKVVIINDTSEQTRASVQDLENNIISGMILVLLVLFLFMGGARNALMVALSIPLSMCITFAILSGLGYTLNFVVLFSLILALGMLVDNAIVIVENIYRHASEGKDLKTAAIEGTYEVGWAVFSSTMTTVGAFFPMIFWPGTMGKFMGFLPRVVMITLLASMFVALFINPVLAVLLLKIKPGGVASEFDVPDNIIYRAYTALLRWCVGHRLVTLLITGGLFVGTFIVFGKTNKGVEFFPAGAPETFTVKIETPDGSHLDVTDEVVTMVVDPLDGKLNALPGMTPEEKIEWEKELAEGLPLVEAWIEDVGVGGGGGFAAGGKAPHYAKVSVDLLAAEDQKTDPRKFMQVLRKTYAQVPGAQVVLETQSMGPPAGKPIDVEIVGEDLVTMAGIAQQVKNRIETLPGIIDLDDNLELTRPEIQVIVDRERAALAGVDTMMIASTVRTAINGNKATVFREGKDEYDITVRLPEELRRSVQDLSKLMVVNRDKFQIPLTEVAHIVVRGGTGSIRHKDQDRVVNITANAAPGVLPANLLKDVQDHLKDLKLPPGYRIRFVGENEDQKAAGAFLGKAMLAALFIIAMVLVTQFNSILQTFIIMCSVILSLMGVLWNLIIFQAPFGVIMTGIAVISLAGVVVNNAIVLIDYANQLKRRGMSSDEAILITGPLRLRPVLLTTMTTVLGFLPLVIGVSVDFVNQKVVVGGRSVDMWSPMARATAVGLVVATALTLLVVPVLYSLFDAMSERAGNLYHRAFGAKEAAALAAILMAGAAGSMIAPQRAQAQEPPAEPAFSRPQDVQQSGEEVRAVAVELSTLEIPSARMMTLTQAKEMMHKQSLDIQIAMTNIEIADAMVKKAYGTLIPSLTVGFNGTLYDKEITAGFGAPGSPPAVIRPQFDYRWTAAASLRVNPRAWPLLQQAYLNQDLNKAQVEAIRDELDFAVVQTYYNMLLVRRLMELSAQRVASDRTTLQAYEKQQRAGVIQPFELTRARLRLVQSEQDLEKAKLQFVQLRSALANILQTEPNFDVERPADLEMKRTEEVLREEARSQRANLKAQRVGEATLAKSKEEVYWQYLPTADITASAFRPKGTLLSPGEWQYSLGFNVQWLLWDGGIREAELDERDAKLRAQIMQRRKTEAEISNNLSQAWSDYLSMQAQVASAKAQRELAAEGFKQSESAWKLGAARQLDVIVSEDQLRLAELSLIQEEIRLQLAIHKLLYLAGID
jgi:multidrug efflux pump subunit AcrB/outer membrane protein TolC